MNAQQSLAKNVLGQGLSLYEEVVNGLARMPPLTRELLQRERRLFRSCEQETALQEVEAQIGA